MITNMKKTWLLATLLIFAVACGGNKKDDEQKDTKTQEVNLRVVGTASDKDDAPKLHISDKKRSTVTPATKCDNDFTVVHCVSKKGDI